MCTLVSVSCTGEIEKQHGSEVAPLEIIAGHESDDDTKTTISMNADRVGTIYWIPADKINVFYGTVGLEYTSMNTENTTVATFKTKNIVEITEEESVNVWGMYPYNASATCDGAKVRTSIPNGQTAVPGTFDDDMFTALAHSATNELLFYNVCGGIKFSLSRSDIQRITLKGNNDEVLAGEVDLTFIDGLPVASPVTGKGETSITLIPKTGATFESGKDFYLMTLPVKLDNGFTMTFETSKEVGTFNFSSGSIEISRSVFTKMENIDTFAEFIDTTPYVTFVSEEENKMNMASITGFVLGDGEYFEYSVGNGKWEIMEFNKNISFGGETGSLRIRGKSSKGTVVYENYSYKYLQVQFADDTNPVSCSGDIRTLVDWENYNSCSTEYAGFYSLFMNCKSLTTSPSLPAETLAVNCYAYMFRGCTSLITAPALSAETLADRCYAYMFEGCASLTTAPALPAKTLEIGCYRGMFKGCTSLTKAPILPAKKLVVYCYDDLFAGCTNLSEITVLTTDIPTFKDFYYWLSDGAGSLASTRVLTLANEDVYNDLACWYLPRIWQKGYPGTTVQFQE